MSAQPSLFQHGPLCAWPECRQERRPRRSDPLCTMHRTRLDRGIDMDAPRLHRRAGSPPPRCYVSTCDAPAHSRGLCHGHLQRVAKGLPLEPPLQSRPRGTLAQRLWRYVEKNPDGCWLWTGAPDRHGYGWISSGGRGSGKLAVHRVSYELLVGTIPEGLHLDHLCRTPLCVRPDHLEPVTQAENNRRALPFLEPRHKTHCPKGHPYSGDNLYVRPSGSYSCRRCERDRMRIRRAS